MPNNQSLYEQIISTYPELIEDTKVFAFQTIVLQNDGDGTGDYIAKWNYSKPIPESLKNYDRS
jgi:hypothetical protein